MGYQKKKEIFYLNLFYWKPEAVDPQSLMDIKVDNNVKMEEDLIILEKN